MHDPDIWRAATLLFDQYGDNAVLRAAQRADQLMDDGDVEGVAVWRAGIVDAIEELQRGRREWEAVN